MDSTAHYVHHTVPKIKQEFNQTTHSFQSMSSCMYQQQHPMGHMSASLAGSRSRMYRIHMAKENSQLANCRRRLDFNNSEQNLFYGISKHNPQISVARRNERERNRVKLINMTFATLRDHLPYEAETNTKSKKMSKVDTLKAAIDYIKYLQGIVEVPGEAGSSTIGDNCNIDTCVQFDITKSNHQQNSPTATSVASESSFDGLSTEDEDLLDFASWF